MIQYLKKTNPSNHRRASSGSDRRRCTKTRRRRTGRSNNDTAFTSERVGGMYSYGCVCGSGGREEFLHPSQFPLQTMSSVSWIGGGGNEKDTVPRNPTGRSASGRRGCRPEEKSKATHNHAAFRATNAQAREEVSAAEEIVK